MAATAEHRGEQDVRRSNEAYITCPNIRRRLLCDRSQIGPHFASEPLARAASKRAGSPVKRGRDRPLRQPRSSDDDHVAGGTRTMSPMVGPTESDRRPRGLAVGNEELLEDRVRVAPGVMDRSGGSGNGDPVRGWQRVSVTPSAVVGRASAGSGQHASGILWPGTVANGPRLGHNAEAVSANNFRRPRHP